MVSYTSVTLKIIESKCFLRKGYLSENGGAQVPPMVNFINPAILRLEQMVLYT